MPPQSERDIIVLDEEPWAFRYEHALMNHETNKRDFYTVCLADTEDCPACHVDDKEGTYVMYLSVLDLEPWTTRAGVLVEYSRRLYVVKARQQNVFKRKYDAMVQEGKKGLRGLRVKLYRDDDRSPVIGNDFEWGKRVSEARLAEYINEYDDRKGNHHVENLGEVLDYDRLFPPMNRKQLAQLVGYNQPVPGSDEEAEDEDVDDWDKDSADDTPWDDGPKKSKTKVKAKTEARPRARVKRRARTRT